jgi:WD40 repeat protein
VLTSSADGTVRLWDAATGSNTFTVQPAKPQGSNYRASGIFSPDGTKVVTMLQPDTLGVGYWTNGGAIEIHDAFTGARLASVTEGFAITAALSPDNKQLATGGFDSAAKLWDVASGKVRFELHGHESRIPSASFSPNGVWLLTASWDGTVRVWETATGRSVAVLNTGKMVDAAAFSADGNLVATLASDPGEQDKYVQLWDWRNTPGGSLSQFEAREGFIDDFALSPNGKRLVTAGTDSTARIWETGSGKCLHVLSGHQDGVTGVDIGPNSEWVVTASNDGTARIWEMATGESLMQLGGDGPPRKAAAFSADGKRIVVASAGGDAVVYTCALCGSLDDLLSLARARVTRQLTAEERQKYLSDTPAP